MSGGWRKRLPGSLFLLTVIVILGLLFTKRININTFFAGNYALQGVDVSHYQGDIDWRRLQEQGIDFAFIKATEGSSYTDPCFQRNWQKGAGAELYLGAYHFFSFDSDAAAQAEHFIRTVGNLSGKIAPVIDIEYYSDKESHPPDQKAVREELGELCRILEEYYGVRPIIYTTYRVYHRYIAGAFDDYPLWIRNVFYPPDWDMRGKWSFWQYTDRAVLEGYQGQEKYIDRNVFGAGTEEFEGMIVP